MRTPPAGPLPLRNSYWALPGQVLAGEYPGGSTRQKTQERLGKLLDAGIESFVDLTQPDELLAYDVHLPEGVAYLRKPIKDHGLPGARAHMTQILEVIQDSIRARRPVYVHCRAGIGRTATVIGCLLVERGLSGSQALEELNRLWRQSARSKSWPVVPETEDQAGYVRAWTARTSAAKRTGPKGIERRRTASQSRGTPRRRSSDRKNAPVALVGPAAVGEPAWASEVATVAEPLSSPVDAAVPPPHEADPLLDPSTLSAARGLRERFLGALLGLAVGDAIAAATQFRRPGSFTPVGDLLGGGPFDLPRGAWSDDTAMTLCLVESLLEQNAFDPRDQVQRYARWQKEGYLSSTGHCVGITASTARALAISKWRRHVFAGSHDPDQLDPEPLSRVAAVTLFFFASLDATVVHAADSARTTCQAPIVLESCRRLAGAMHAALSGQTKSAILADAAPLTESAAQVNSTAPSALAAAYWAFSTTDNYREAVLRAVNVGGNSDVVAAVCGQLAGAHYGAGAIPAAWRNGLIQKDLIENFGDRLLAHALLSLAD